MPTSIVLIPEEYSEDILLIYESTKTSARSSKDARDVFVTIFHQNHSWVCWAGEPSKDAEGMLKSTTKSVSSCRSVPTLWLFYYYEW